MSASIKDAQTLRSEGNMTFTLHMRFPLKKESPIVKHIPRMNGKGKKYHAQGWYTGTDTERNATVHDSSEGK